MICTGPTRFVDSVKFSKGRIYFHGEIVTRSLGADILDRQRAPVNTENRWQGPRFKLGSKVELEYPARNSRIHSFN